MTELLLKNNLPASGTQAGSWHGMGNGHGMRNGREKNIQ
jgi:hypothetical protein